MNIFAFAIACIAFCHADRTVVRIGVLPLSTIPSMLQSYNLTFEQYLTTEVISSCNIGFGLVFKVGLWALALQIGSNFSPNLEFQIVNVTYNSVFSLVESGQVAFVFAR